MLRPVAQLNPPFRAEHIGSFFRPPALLQARAGHAVGSVSDAELRQAENAAIRDFVALQEGLGFKLVTDGELRRSTYTSNFTTSGLTGVSSEPVDDPNWSYTNASGHKDRPRLPAVHDRIRWHNSPNAEDFAFLREVTRQTPKLTLPGPCYIHFRAGRARISRDVYPDLADFWSDLVAAYAVELKKLYDAGCRYVQLDETSIAKLGDAEMRATLAARGDPWEALLEQYIDVINAVVASAPAGMRVGMHLCRGNYLGHWQAAGGYEVVAERLFRGVAIDFFFLEYDSERAGSFEPLQKVPPHKVVVLGLVSTKAAALEPQEFLRKRIDDCARYVDRERLAISPQCGFSSSEAGNTVMSHAQGVAKLRRVVEVAQNVWGD